MDGKKLVKNIAKFAALVLGIFILSQAVSAKYFSFNLSNGNQDYGYTSYIVYDSRPAYYEPAPVYYYAPPVVSYDYHYKPLTTWGTYYANDFGGYPYGAYYNTYSPYDNSFYSPVTGYYSTGYSSYYSGYYPTSYSYYPEFIVYN